MNPEFPFLKGQKGSPETPEGRNLPEQPHSSTSDGERGVPLKTLGTPESTPLDEALLDQLVDGELSVDDQRKALQQVQTHPEGWRRLALAFLEAQAWRKHLPLLVGNPPHQHTPPPAQLPTVGQKNPAVRGRKNLLVWQLLTLAGGLLLAFAGGYWTKEVVAPLRSKPQEVGVQHGESPQPGGRESFPKGKETFASLPKHPQFPHLPSPPQETLPGEAITGPEPWHSPAPSGWDYVTLTTGTGPDGIPEVVRVPVRQAGPDLRLPRGPLPLPEELLQILRQWGAGISHSRQWLPLRMEDGREVVVPVEQVELYYRPRSQRYQ